MQEHLDRYWNLLCSVPANALKTITGGRLKGKSDISPQWRYEKMTEIFGPCGFGWKYTIDKKWSEAGDHGEVFAFVDVSIYVKDGETWSEAIPGTGGSMIVEAESAGLHNNDEAYKMATTDALGTAMKMLGLAADVYRGNNSGSKYLPQQEPPQQQPPRPPAQTGEFTLSGILVDVSEKTGKTGNRSWKAFTAKLDNGEQAGTLAAEIGQSMKALLGKSVELLCQKNAKGYNTIQALYEQRSPAAPPPVSTTTPAPRATPAPIEVAESGKRIDKGRIAYLEQTAKQAGIEMADLRLWLEFAYNYDEIRDISMKHYPEIAKTVAEDRVTIIKCAESAKKANPY
jgi:hypothetical protein